MPINNQDINQKDAPRWQARLFDARFMLFAVFFLLAIFTITSSISLVVAIISFIFFILVSLFIPRKKNSFPLYNDRKEIFENVREKIAFRFCETLTDPTLILDEKNIIIYANLAAKKQFIAVKAGDPVAFFIRSPALLHSIKDVRNSTKAKTIELYQAGMNETWFDISISLLKLQRKQSSFIVLNMHDLSEQKRSEAMRSDFIANASHELRTPLTSIIGFIETIEGPAANDKKAREKFLKIMRAQADRMSKLVDDLLSLSRIELRQNIKPKSKVNLSNLLSLAVEELQNQAKSAQVEVILNLPKEPVIIKADEEELFEVFENLIDNAIKYGSDGNKVNVNLNKNPLNNKFDYSVNVIDYGQGISAEHVPRLTERFYRVDAQNSRKKKGTGLGLAIVKHIINRHAGEMIITSRENIGTNVEVLLNK